MSSQAPPRETTLALLKTYNQGESLIKHAYAVEGVMRYMARKYNEDEDTWGVVGLIHDLDYEQFPDQHCKKTEAILKENNWPEELIRAVISHGWGICTDVKPESTMEKVLFAIDELTGLVATSALVRPTKSVMDMNAKSVKKNGRISVLPQGWIVPLFSKAPICSGSSWVTLSPIPSWACVRWPTQSG